ncbi:BspA family leucine-rich repeat surface protein, partial [Mycoplasma bovis]|nr:BspA family leucine-rich repeat surface protein [Mycoplasmopsis bovis]
SAHNYTVILNMLKDSIEDAELKNSISLANSDEARKRPVKEQEGQKIMFKVGSEQVDLELGKVTIGKQSTIYIGKDGMQHETDAQDLSLDEKAKEATVIVRIGYYDDSKTIRVAQMPKTVTKVPTELPKEITNLHKMFLESKEFNQDISSWDLSGVYNTSLMFYKAEKFNQDITNWNTENVTNMRSMFYGTKAYDKDLSRLNVSSVKDAVEFAKAAKTDWAKEKQPQFKEGTLLERPKTN